MIISLKQQANLYWLYIFGKKKISSILGTVARTTNLEGEN